MPSYDVEMITQNLSLRDVCDYLNIPYRHQSGDEYVCALRNEKTASCSLNFANNSFYDFGDNSLKGGVIGFVGYAVFGLTDMRDSQNFQNVCGYICNTFGINAERTSAAKIEFPPADYVYKTLGIHPDSVLKNILDLSEDNKRVNYLLKEYGGMTIAECATQHPKMYMQILSQIGMDTAYKQKRELLMDIARFAEMSPLSADYATAHDKLVSQHRSYNAVYRSLCLANNLPDTALESGAKRADLRAYAVASDVDTMIDTYNKGIDGSNWQVGTKTHYQMSRLSFDKRDARTAELSSFAEFDKFSLACEGIPYSAFLNGRGKPIKITFLSKDLSFVWKQFPQSANDNGRAIARETAIQQQRAENKLTDFGRYFKQWCLEHNFNQTDVGRAIGIPETEHIAKRVSELLTTDESRLSERQTERLTALKKYTNFQRRAAAVYTTNKAEYAKLTHEEQQRAVEEYGKQHELATGKPCPMTNAQIHNMLMKKSAIISLSDMSVIATGRVKQDVTIIGTINYSKIKNPFCVEFAYPKDIHKQLLNDMQVNNAEFSSAWYNNQTKLKITLPNEDRNIREFAEACQRVGVETPTNVQSKLLSMPQVAPMAL